MSDCKHRFYAHNDNIGTIAIRKRISTTFSSDSRNDNIIVPGASYLLPQALQVASYKVKDGAEMLPFLYRHTLLFNFSHASYIHPDFCTPSSTIILPLLPSCIFSIIRISMRHFLLYFHHYTTWFIPGRS